MVMKFVLCLVFTVSPEKLCEIFGPGFTCSLSVDTDRGAHLPVFTVSILVVKALHPHFSSQEVAISGST